MSEWTHKFYRGLVSVVKKADRLTNYKIGDLVRRQLNANTPEYWDRYLAKKGETWRSFTYDFLLQELPQDRPFSLLDIGCALGDGCAFLRKNFPNGDIYGADLSRVGVEKAKEKSGSDKYFCLDIARQDPPRMYDYITLIHLLEHFDDPFPIIDKCLKSVKEAVILNTPYGGEFEDPRLYWKGEHRYLFNEKTFQNYNCTVLKVTDFIEAVGTKHIYYKITP